jgi:hypothetical protein
MAAPVCAPAQDPSTLLELHHLIALAAFAAEARRVLIALEGALHAHPHIERTLSDCIDARQQWQQLPDALPDVLTDAQRRLGEWLESAG